jgi:hypothetical protein
MWKLHLRFHLDQRAEDASSSCFAFRLRRIGRAILVIRERENPRPAKEDKITISANFEQGFLKVKTGFKQM